MTTISEIDVRCAVCGALSRKATLTSTNSFGPPDLDLRPQGDARWALEFAVQRCNACGYCAESIGQAPVGARETVESAVYRDVLQRSKLPRLARSLFCAALVHDAAGRPEASAWRFLEAAWACDDRRARGRARTCRERAAEMFHRALETGEVEAHEAVVLTLTADLLRRAGRFDEALARCDLADAALAEADDEELQGTAAVATFIRQCAEQEDDASHHVGEVFAGEE